MRDHYQLSRVIVGCGIAFCWVFCFIVGCAGIAETQSKGGAAFGGILIMSGILIGIVGHAFLAGVSAIFDMANAARQQVFAQRSAPAPTATRAPSGAWSPPGIDTSAGGSSKAALTAEDLDRLEQRRGR